MKTGIRKTKSGIEIRLGTFVHIFNADGSYFGSEDIRKLLPLSRAAEEYKWIDRKQTAKVQDHAKRTVPGIRKKSPG